MSQTDRGEAAHPKLQHVKQAAAHELRRYVTIAAYLWLLLFVISLVEDGVLRGERMPLIKQGFVLVNALVLGKIMLLTEDLRIGERIVAQPLIWPILLDSLIMSLLLIASKYLEEGLKGMIEGHGFAASLPVLGGGGFAGILGVALIGFVALTPFFAVSHLDRALGPGRLYTLLLGRGQA